MLYCSFFVVSLTAKTSWEYSRTIYNTVYIFIIIMFRHFQLRKSVIEKHWILFDDTITLTYILWFTGRNVSMAFDLLEQSKVIREVSPDIVALQVGFPWVFGKSYIILSQFIEVWQNTFQLGSFLILTKKEVDRNTHRTPVDEFEIIKEQLKMHGEFAAFR
jgi:hypothetical protein